MWVWGWRKGSGRKEEKERWEWKEEAESAARYAAANQVIVIITGAHLRLECKKSIGICCRRQSHVCVLFVRRHNSTHVVSLPIRCRAWRFSRALVGMFAPSSPAFALVLAVRAARMSDSPSIGIWTKRGDAAPNHGWSEAAAALNVTTRRLSAATASGSCARSSASAGTPSFYFGADDDAAGGECCRITFVLASPEGCSVVYSKPTHELPITRDWTWLISRRWTSTYCRRLSANHRRRLVLVDLDGAHGQSRPRSVMSSSVYTQLFSRRRRCRRCRYTVCICYRLIRIKQKLSRLVLVAQLLCRPTPRTLSGLPSRIRT